MEQRDYFMRQVEQLGHVLGILVAKLLGIKQQGKLAEGIALIDETLVEQVDLDLASLLSIENGKLVKQLTINQEFTLAQVDFVAELLYQTGEFYQWDSDKETLGRLYWEKAQILFQYVTNNDPVFSFDRQKKIDRIFQAENDAY